MSRIHHRIRTDASVAYAAPDPAGDGTPYQGLLVPMPQYCPGAVACTDLATILSPDYTKRVRDVTHAEKKAVAVTDGIDPNTLGQYEVDHYVPLIWGGSNSPQNLWCQPLAQAKVKDVVEVHGRIALEKGLIPLADLQASVMKSWVQAALLVDQRLATLSPQAFAQALSQDVAEFKEEGDKRHAKAAAVELRALKGAAVSSSLP